MSKRGPASLIASYVLLGVLSLLLYAPPLFLLLLDGLLLVIAAFVLKAKRTGARVVGVILTIGALALIARDVYLLLG